LGEENRDADIAASFQEAIVDTLVKKSVKALKQTGLKRLSLQVE
jgi:N6-L-threonylcarbamoyladenine synthase